MTIETYERDDTGAQGDDHRHATYLADKLWRASKRALGDTPVWLEMSAHLRAVQHILSQPRAEQ